MMHYAQYGIQHSNYLISIIFMILGNPHLNQNFILINRTVLALNIQRLTP